MDINNFGPFASDVWGNVSDWFIFIVTFFTLIYIVLTFRAQYKSIALQDETLKSQLEVQRIQNDQYKMEVRKFSYEKLPRFELVDYAFDRKLEIIDAVQLSSLNRFWVDIGFFIYLRGDLAREIKIKNILSSSHTLTHTSNEDNLSRLEIIHSGEKIKLSYFIQGDVGQLTASNGAKSWYFESKLIFEINYKDQLGNSVSQHLTCFVSNSDKPLIINSEPIITDSIF